MGPDSDGIHREDVDPDDVAALADYVRAHGQQLARVARLLVGDPQLADDLVQDVLVKVLASWSRIRHTANLDAYLYRCLVNARNSLWWRARHEVWLAQVPEAVSPDASDDVLRRHWLAAELRALPRGQRTAVVLRYYADLGERQVAEIMGCSVGTVRSQTARGVSTLRRAMRDETPDATTVRQHVQWASR